MKSNKITIILLLALTIIIGGCNAKEEFSSIEDNIDSDTVWIYARFNVPKEDKSIDTYYYYGEVSKTLYDDISNNQLSHGFILLRNVKYWGNDDLINSFKSNESYGSLIFRIEDIRKIERIRVEPITGKGQEQFKDKKKKDTEEVSIDTDTPISAELQVQDTNREVSP